MSDDPSARSLPARAMRTMVVCDVVGVSIIVVDFVTGGPTWYTGLGIAVLVLGGVQFALRLVAAGVADAVDAGDDPSDAQSSAIEHDDRGDDEPHASPITFH